MTGWFAKLMQRSQTRSHRAIAVPGSATNADGGRTVDARDARYDAIVHMLRDRAVEDRHAREKRQRWYGQHVKSDSATRTGALGSCSPIRLYKFRTKVSCRTTPEARALLDEFRKRFPGSTVTFPQVTSGEQAVMLSADDRAPPRHIGWVEHCPQTDPERCNVRNQGLAVETDGGTMLVLRFRYPPTAVRMFSQVHPDQGMVPHSSGLMERRESAEHGGDEREHACGGMEEVARVDFTEIRLTLDLRPSEKGVPPRLVWVTRPEVETMNALGSRDYEAFYVRFKLEVLAGIWSSLTGVLSSSPGSRWHQGSHYTVVREPDATIGKIQQRTVDDSGCAIDIGSDRIYDAFPATDVLLLYLDGDILADVADIYFTLQSMSSTDAYFLKEEFFSVIRRFWANSQSLASRYGSSLPAVVRMSQRALPMPAQVPLLKQDWTNLRQSLVDRYGEGGRKAADLIGQNVDRPRIGPPGWPFASFPAGEVNLGLRLVYRQEWRHVGVHRGEVITPARPGCGAGSLTSVEATLAQPDATRHLHEVVDDAVKATAEAMKWPVDFDGSINMGVRGLAAGTDMGLESECRESSRDTSTRLTEIVRRMASRIQNATPAATRSEPEQTSESSFAAGLENPADGGETAYVYRRLQHRYEILTRPAEIQNVVLVAEKLPTPGEIDLSWVRRHAWILAKVLLDESVRDALDTVPHDAAEAPLDRSRLDLELDAKRDRLYEHLRDHILHYQQAIWQQEDSQQRRLRYRKWGRKVPLEWRFELESGGTLTIDELGDRLAATSVDGHFAAYSAGREADLDQVIDPAGPIGYYGNYAVYHMRPEFASADLFSMLHFFKSPYLRPNPETGEPEVEDPLYIEIANDPAVMSPSDEMIDEHREAMFQYVPELRLALAQAGQKLVDGTDASAVDGVTQHSEVLRRHFATYLFRREQTRRIVLDSDRVVIDVVRSVGPAPEESQRSDGVIDQGRAPEDYQLILEGGVGTVHQTANGHRDTEGAWVILRGNGEQAVTLRAGGDSTAAGARGHEGLPVIVARDDAGLTLTGAGGEAAQPDERAFLTVADEERPSWLLAGTPPAEPVVLARDDGAPRLTAAGGGAANVHEQVILSESDAGRMPCLHAGRAHDAEAARVIVARDDEGLSLKSVAGGGSLPTRERVIVARDDEWLRPSPVAG